MFNEIDKIHVIIKDITKDNDCNVQFVSQGYGYFIQVSWYQRGKFYSHRRTLTKDMLMQYPESVKYIINEVIKAVRYEYGKIEYEALA